MQFFSKKYKDYKPF